MLIEFAGDPLEWPEWSEMYQFAEGRFAQSNDEKMSRLKALSTGAARRSADGRGFSGSQYRAALSTLERKFRLPHFIISAELSRIQSYTKFKYQDFRSLKEFTNFRSIFLGVPQQIWYSNYLFSSNNSETFWEVASWI